MEKPETPGAEWLPGVSNMHLMASLGSPEMDSDGRISGHEARESECPAPCMEPVGVRGSVRGPSGCTSQS